MIERVFYVTQGALRVCFPNARDERSDIEFADDDRGVREFERFLATAPDISSTMLIDVIEEEFFLDTIPKLAKRDRDALIRRRRQQKFHRTHYRTSQYIGKSARKEGQFAVVHSAISNHELVDPWLDVLLKYQTPLSGIFSVPLMAAAMLKRLFSCTGNAIFVAPHQGNKLRQVFVKDGHVMSARLSQGPGSADSSYAQFVVTEVMRSRQYLERTRLLSGNEGLEICVVADNDTGSEITSIVSGDGNNNYQFAEPVAAARRALVPSLKAVDHFEEVFVAAVAKGQPRNGYANTGENRYWQMRRLRTAIIGVAAIGAVAASVVAALLLSDAWIIKQRNIEIQLQADYLLATYRKENERLDPIKADSYEMKLAVDTGELILANRVPVPWVMNQVGTVLGGFNDVRIQELQWTAEPVQLENAQAPRRGEAPVVNVESIAAVSAILTADIVSFDGNLRHAFARIDALAADFESQTNFQSAVAIEYPLDAKTSAAISGEISKESNNKSARFRIQLHYALPGKLIAGGGNDEST